jgi:hypothetical protein
MSAGPKQIGTEAGTIYYTGASETFEACRDVLEVMIGTSVYSGAEMGRAAALDFAHLGVILRYCHGAVQRPRAALG